MPTEETLDLDALDAGAFEAELKRLEEEGAPLVTVTASLGQWERIREALLALRSANISPLLLIRRGEQALDDEQIVFVFSYLKLWDQFLLHNFLELCGDWLPPEAVGPLAAEAKIEIKWFKEWWTASTDARIAKYPGLPWRRFIRKINAENHEFVSRFFDLADRPATAESAAELKEHLKVFLMEKKKAVNLFPKRWNRSEHHG